jgi:hypothetical protein
LLILCTSFIEGIKRNPWLTNARLLFFCERNTGNESGHIEKALFPYGVQCIRQKEDKDPGWWTDRSLKVKYAYSARYHMVTGSVFYMKDMVCTNPFLEDPSARLPTVTKKFSEQASRYKFTYTKPTTPFAEKKVTVSGKVNEQGKIGDGFNDDLFFTFTMAIYHTDEVIQGRTQV